MPFEINFQTPNFPKIGRRLASFGVVLRHLASFDVIWLYLALFGVVWPKIASALFNTLIMPNLVRRKLIQSELH